LLVSASSAALWRRAAADPSTAADHLEASMANPFVHVELHTKDLAKAKAFYTKLFDWKLDDMPMPGGGGSYTLINVGEGTGGGMMQSEDPNMPPFWLAYVGVADVVASTKRAKDLGATVLHDVVQVGDFGKMSVLSDPTGAHIALWQPLGKK
jgi:predicted enzyme related to lactoylglutathione lyase